MSARTFHVSVTKTPITVSQKITSRSRHAAAKRFIQDNPGMRPDCVQAGNDDWAIVGWCAHCTEAIFDDERAVRGNNGLFHAERCAR